MCCLLIIVIICTVCSETLTVLSAISFRMSDVQHDFNSSYPVLPGSQLMAIIMYICIELHVYSKFQRQRGSSQSGDTKQLLKINVFYNQIRSYTAEDLQSQTVPDENCG